MEPKKILIVEDEMDMRIFVATLMEVHGHKPVLAPDGKKGLQKARSGKPDLIVLDVMMPNGGGVEMYRALKEDSALCNIPVIMLTAVAQKTVRHYLKMLGIRSEKPMKEPDGYMEKPPDAQRLAELAALLLGRNECETGRLKGELKDPSD